MIKNILRKAINFTGYEIQKIKNHYDEELYLSLYGKDSVANRKFYNISAGGHLDFGCGIHHPIWTNIDVDRHWEKQINYNPKYDIAHDLLSLGSLPVESNSAEVVHSRTTIEHIPDAAAMVMFKEVKRILKKGGFFRIVTPNIDLDYRALLNNDIHFYFWLQNFSIEQAFLFHFAHGASIKSREISHEKITDEKLRYLFKNMSTEEVFNYCTSKCDLSTQAKGRHHINWWNHKKLECMLRNAGFSTIYSSLPGQSACPILRNEFYFDNVWPKVMLYMEAIND